MQKRLALILGISFLFFLVAKLLYKSKCPSVCMYVCMAVCLSGLGGNVIFSAPNWDIVPIFFVQIPLINEHLFYKDFVHLSVGNATKGFATYGCFHPYFYSKILRFLTDNIIYKSQIKYLYIICKYTWKYDHWWTERMIYNSNKYKYFYQIVAPQLGLWGGGEQPLLFEGGTSC